MCAQVSLLSVSYGLLFGIHKLSIGKPKKKSKGEKFLFYLFNFLWSYSSYTVIKLGYNTSNIMK